MEQVKLGFEFEERDTCESGWGMHSTSHRLGQIELVAQN
jgi:hypothetical protein